MAHMAQAEEEEPALFLAHGFLELETEEGRGKEKALTFCVMPAAANLHIDEPCARVFLGTALGRTSSMAGTSTAAPPTT